MYPASNPPWRFAATLIIAARSQPPVKPPFDYRLLLLNRSAKSAFMPNQYVFPGGTVSDSDFSNRWMNLFEKSGYDFNTLKHDFVSQNRTPILDRRYYPDSSLSTDIALRICAIRETFEESGVLVARRAKNGSRLFFQGDEDGCRQSWRKEVYANADRFVDMCEDMDIVPDVWSLSEWANWLTPTGSKATRRFDTIFYICTPEQSVESMNVEQDDQEMVNAKWLTPGEAIVGVATRTLNLAPPQTYEILRLVNYTSQNDLENHHRARSRLGLLLNFPRRYQMDDGVIISLPGDSLYPDQPDFITPADSVPLPGTIAEQRHKDQLHHRIEQPKNGPRQVVCNITFPYGYSKPLDFQNLVKLLSNQSNL